MNRPRPTVSPFRSRSYLVEREYAYVQHIHSMLLPGSRHSKYFNNGKSARWN